MEAIEFPFFSPYQLLAAAEVVSIGGINHASPDGHY